MVADWQGVPLTVGAACQQMKSGSNRTREERLKRAIDDGYLIKERRSDDGRSALLRPSPKLEDVMTEHLGRTLAAFFDTFQMKRPD